MATGTKRKRKHEKLRFVLQSKQKRKLLHPKKKTNKQRRANNISWLIYFTYKINARSRTIQSLQASASDIVKYDEKLDEVKIKTADISNKFKFFETYKPSSTEKKPFRITPPRDGVLQQQQQQQQHDAAQDDDETAVPNNGPEYIDASRKAAQRSSTTTKMLSVFRQMEEDVRSNRNDNVGLKPLKDFTPPPDGGRRFFDRKSQSDSECSESDEDSEDDDSDAANNQRRPMDQALQEAQAAARAKHLRAKFEKWEQEEIKREQERGYDGEDQSQIDTRW